MPAANALHQTRDARGTTLLVARRAGGPAAELSVGEHFSASSQPIPSPLMLLAHVAARTAFSIFGTAVVNLPYHHPCIVAAEAAQFDHLSKGRFILGVGPGGLVSDFEMFGVVDRNVRTGWSWRRWT
jgi:alkanesulfonate monooxygenase SsuD/methylene tetrahydromethanopterin reductase-like flavin-dependent oxidoreductase (luciferase family)